jgi:FixJ family two-component response regulator
MMEKGALAFLRKPYTAREILKHLREIIDRGEHPSAS